jgi:hypothetical protein
VRFSLDEAQAAADEWRFNCGPGALCAILNMTPDEIRPHLLGFERKGYTNPSLMADILRGLQVPFRRVFEQIGRCHRNALKVATYPNHGLVRIQWDGPWCDPGRPAVARYRHTHWIAVRNYLALDAESFDVNAMCVGGWIPRKEWGDELQPWLLKQCEPRANGRWWPTHCWEIPTERLAHHVLPFGADA